MSICKLPDKMIEEINEYKADFLDNTPWARLLVMRNLNPPSYQEIIDNNMLGTKEDIIGLYVAASFIKSFRNRYGIGLDSAGLLFGISKYLQAMPDEYAAKAEQVIQFLEAENVRLREMSESDQKEAH